MDAAGLVSQLARACPGQVHSDAGSCEAYATDASLYRRRPVAVLRARDTGDLEAAVAACRDTGVPLTMRGAGTSLAGQAVGAGLVVDTSALRSLTIDPDASTATVEPGVVLDALNRAAAAHGLVFGPDVATASRATLGGMIANNSAGARSIAYGLTADHVEALDVTFADGSGARLRRGDPAPAALEGARPLAGHAVMPALLRRVSGYNLDALAGDRPDWPRVVAGSEGTLAVVRRAVLRLSRRPAARGLALIAFPDVDRALEAVPGLLPAGPSAIELLDRAMLDPRNRAPATRQLVAFAGDAEAMLLVEYQGEADEVTARLAAHRGALLVGDPAEQAAVWAVRRTGIARALGLGGRDEKPLPFIEDPAVPPERLAEAARRIRAVLDRAGMPAVWYGHASVGCLHIRPLLDLRAPGAPALMRRVARRVAEIVVDCDGSLSGEHGDGRVRSEFLPLMYPERTIAAFAGLKRALDPDRILNPGVIVDPEPMDRHLALVDSGPLRAHRTALDFGPEGGLARAAEACNANGTCRADPAPMCPSWQVTGDERHSPRGRARMVRAALEGRLPGGLADPGLGAALDLCLGCAACASDCPAQVDVARFKVEALAARHRASGVPVSARIAGHAHEIYRAGSRMPRLTGAAARAGAALARRRPPPAPARAWRPPPPGDGTPVALFADTFMRFVEPRIGDAAVRVIAGCGGGAVVVTPGCCGRPLWSQGLVGAARRRVTAVLDALTPMVDRGLRVIVAEPTCRTMLTHDAATISDDPRLARVAAAVVGLERWVLERPEPPMLGPLPGEILVHAHCHARARGGDDAAAALRLVPGLHVRESGAGCCGMAGAFGYDHPELSRRIFAHGLGAALADAPQVGAGGASCREQCRSLAPDLPQVRHPVEVLAAALDAGSRTP